MKMRRFMARVDLCVYKMVVILGYIIERLEFLEGSVVVDRDVYGWLDGRVDFVYLLYGCLMIVSRIRR